MKLSTSLIKDGAAAVQTFLKETRTEAKKVVWPSRQYVFAASVIILLILLVTAAFLMSVDYAFGRIFAYLLRAH